MKEKKKHYFCHIKPLTKLKNSNISNRHTLVAPLGLTKIQKSNLSKQKTKI